MRRSLHRARPQRRRGSGKARPPTLQQGGDLPIQPHSTISRAGRRQLLRLRRRGRAAGARLLWRSGARREADGTARSKRVNSTRTGGAGRRTTGGDNATTVAGHTQRTPPHTRSRVMQRSACCGTIAHAIGVPSPGVRLACACVSGWLPVEVEGPGGSSTAISAAGRGLHQRSEALR